MTMQHVSFDRLNDFVDGLLVPRNATEIEDHIAACSACRAELERLRALVDRAEALPRAIEPPSRAWGAIRERLTAGTNRVARGWSVASGWRLLAAAAVLLVAGTSALTTLALRWRGAASGSSRPAIERVVVSNASLRAVDESYADVVDELTATLRAQRNALTPETVATLERALGIIDDAIAEARVALAADPANGAVLDVLTANYEQKVQLLRRASELPART